MINTLKNIVLGLCILTVTSCTTLPRTTQSSFDFKAKHGYMIYYTGNELPASVCTPSFITIGSKTFINLYPSSQAGGVFINLDHVQLIREYANGTCTD